MSLFSFGLGKVGGGGGSGDPVHVYPEHQLFVENEEFIIQFANPEDFIIYEEETFEYLVEDVEDLLVDIQEEEVDVSS